jgi:DNA-binding PucR family transcriptional regulator
MHVGEVEDLVEKIGASISRGISVEDLDGVLLAYSSNQSEADHVRVNFLLSKKVPADVSAWQLSHGISSSVHPIAVLANPELGMHGRVCVPLMVQGFRVGYLWVQQKADEQMETAAEIIGQLREVRDRLDRLASLLLDSNTSESEHRSSQEHEFLLACAGDQRALAAMSGWHKVFDRGPWQLVTALDIPAATGGSSNSAPEAPDPQAATVIRRIAALRATIGIGAALFSAGVSTHSVILFRSSAKGQEHANVLDRYRADFSKRSGLPARRIVFGVSEPFNSPRQLSEAYRQAAQAAQATAVDPRLGEIVDCRATGAYQLLSGHTWDQQISINLGLVEAYDINNELLPMLELLYENDGSVQDVADILHLHRSSIYDRLRRLQSLLLCDPLTGHIRLELHLAIKARRWARRPEL